MLLAPNCGKSPPIVGASHHHPFPFSCAASAAASVTASHAHSLQKQNLGSRRGSMERRGECCPRTSHGRCSRSVFYSSPGPIFLNWIDRKRSRRIGDPMGEDLSKPGLLDPSVFCLYSHPELLSVCCVFNPLVLCVSTSTPAPIQRPVCQLVTQDW